MSLTKEDNFEMAGNFVRGSKLRKSFRIRHRYNSNLPPAALIYMKSLEQKKNSENEINTTIKPSIVSVHLKSDIRKKEEQPIRKIRNLTEITELDETFCDDSTPLLRKTSSRNSFKKPAKKYKKKLNKIISFFK